MPEFDDCPLLKLVEVEVDVDVEPLEFPAWLVALSVVTFGGNGDGDGDGDGDGEGCGGGGTCFETGGGRSNLK